MTSEDDPFGRSDRTIIRPNPAGRRPAPAAPGGPPPASTLPPAGGAPPVSTPSPPVSYPAQPGFPPPPARPPPYPPPPASPPPAQTGEFDAWMNQRSPQSLYVAANAPTPMIPAPLSPHVPVEIVTGSDNPLVRASASLLLLLGRLRASLARGDAAQLMDQVAQAIQQFEVDSRAGGAPTEQIQAAKYALAATSDDIVQNLPHEDSRVWTQYSMLIRFFNERMGGVRFFDELERAKQNPAVNLGLLEVMHSCLSLGFEGVYRASGGPGALQAIRRDLYETIRRARSKTVEELSPHWRGQTIPLAGSRFQLPVWVVAAAAGVILLGAYLYFRNGLTGEAETLALRIEAVHPNTVVEITRETPVKPPPDPVARASTQLQRIRKELAAEIMARQLDADQTPTEIYIRIGSLVLFPSGGATVKPGFTPIAARIAAALNPEPGPIHVEGHTDSDPVKTIAFPSNFALSEARARGVAAALKPNLKDPGRLTVAGKGDTVPVAPNDVEEHKAKNRRVEVWIPREETLRSAAR